MKSYTIAEIAAWIDEIFSYAEHHYTDTLYTVEDAAIDLDLHKKDMGKDAGIDLDAITPEQYMEAINYNIVHVWKCYTKDEKNPVIAADSDLVKDWSGWAKAAYIRFYGAEKWDSLTSMQKLNVVRNLAWEMEEALSRIEA